MTIINSQWARIRFSVMSLLWTMLFAAALNVATVVLMWRSEPDTPYGGWGRQGYTAEKVMPLPDDLDSLLPQEWRGVEWHPFNQLDFNGESKLTIGLMRGAERLTIERRKLGWPRGWLVVRSVEQRATSGRMTSSDVKIEMLWQTLLASMLLVWLPLWFAVGLVREMVSQSRRDRNCCTSCGYDLRGSTGRKCPECGAKVTPDSGSSRQHVSHGD
jgi:predicted RNA-binding Zn-ribbon protein involved in translation (DUF1610 family)